MPSRKRKLFHSNVAKSKKQRLARATLSSDYIERLRATDRTRRAIRRQTETEEEHAECLRETNLRQYETDEENAQGLQQQRVRQGTLRVNNWNYLKH